MGWASGGSIFDPVAKALIDAGVSDEVVRSVLSHLIKQLQENDWDTEGESLEEFSQEPAVVAAFAEHGIYLPEDDEPMLGG